MLTVKKNVDCYCKIKMKMTRIKNYVAVIALFIVLVWYVRKQVIDVV